jgi:hypothetical protein
MDRPEMMRRPDRLAGKRISLGRRVIEPESFVSSSCVGDQIQRFNHLPKNKIPCVTRTPT